MKVNPAHIHLSFEDDVMLHNRMLDSINTSITNRIFTSTYELAESNTAIKAVAQLIAAKANKQRFLIEQATENETN